MSADMRVKIRLTGPRPEGGLQVGPHVPGPGHIPPGLRGGGHLGPGGLSPFLLRKPPSLMGEDHPPRHRHLLHREDHLKHIDNAGETAS